MPEGVAKIDRAVKEAADHSAASDAKVTPIPLRNHDVRRRRPPALSFLLRMETLRRASRVASMLAVDYVAVYAAIFTALYLRTVVRGEPDIHGSVNLTNDYFPFVYLVTVLLFARSSLYAARVQRPGLSRIVASLFQVMLVALVYALASGQRSPAITSSTAGCSSPPSMWPARAICTSA